MTGYNLNFGTTGVYTQSPLGLGAPIAQLPSVAGLNTGVRQGAPAPVSTLPSVEGNYPNGNPNSGWNNFKAMLGFGGDSAGVTPQATGQATDWQTLLLGNKNQMGAIQAGAGVLSGLSDMYFGYQNYQLGQDQLNFSKDTFNKNYSNQVQLTNLALRDRQARRYANRPDLYQNPDDYMKENSVK